jgi:hypothetical protein
MQLTRGLEAEIALVEFTPQARPQMSASDEDTIAEDLLGKGTKGGINHMATSA